MKAIVVTDQAAGTAGMKLVERPEPQGAALASLSGANYGDVVVQVHASGFTWDELSWPSTWIDRLGRDRTPSIPGHELAGVVTALSYGTTGLSVGQRVLAPHRRVAFDSAVANTGCRLPGELEMTLSKSTSPGSGARLRASTATYSASVPSRVQSVRPPQPGPSGSRTTARY
jgi:NADPH:quinone reductase-like Zn-dependent oxidoreductase